MVLVVETVVDIVGASIIDAEIVLLVRRPLVVVIVLLIVERKDDTDDLEEGPDGEKEGRMMSGE